MDDELGQFADTEAVDAFAVKEALQLAQARGMTHFAEGLGFNLPDALAGYLKLFTHFLECAAVAVGETEAQLKHFAFALGE